MDKWSSHSFVNNYGHCHLCGAEYKEGWLDEMANETCNNCKVAIDGLDDQELLEEVGDDNLVSISQSIGIPNL